MAVLYPARRSRPRALWLAAVIAGLVALLLALVALPAVGATGTLDQSNLGPTNNYYQ
jgi:zinc transporter ZupT